MTAASVASLASLTLATGGVTAAATASAAAAPAGAARTTTTPAAGPGVRAGAVTAVAGLAVPQDPGLSPGVRRITLDAAGVTLSALLSTPEHTPPRATVVAVHGGGMTAGYFDGQAHPETSLLTLGASLGYTVLAVDRPGYGESAALFPDGLALADQAVLLRAALADFTSRYASGAGLFLLAHSYGGKLALSTCAGLTGEDGLLGLDISGCGHRFAPSDPKEGLKQTQRHWGPLRLYPQGTFKISTSLVAPMPPLEAGELGHWTELFAALAPRIRIPIRLTFAEHEAWWHHGDHDLADLASRLTAAPRVQIDRQPDAGHNISLGWAARSYHLRALAFLEDCMTRAGRAA